MAVSSSKNGVIPPRMLHSAHRIFVEEIMVKDVVIVTSCDSLVEITQVLQAHDFKTFPLVDSRGECANNPLVCFLLRSSFRSILFLVIVFGQSH